MTDMTTTAPSRRADAATPDHPPGAFAWRTLGAVLVLAALTWGTFNVVGLFAHEERTEVTTFDANGVDVVDVANGAGSVTVVGVDGVDTITVTARISDGLRTTGNRQTVDGGRLELRGSCPVLLGSEWCDVDYTVEVPSDVEVVARSGDARIVVSGVDAAIDVDNDNGSIDIADVGGPLTVDNDNGRITATGVRSSTVVATNNNGRVELVFADPPMSVEARSENGTVEVVVPDTDDTYRLDISTENGEVEQLLRIDPASERSILVRSDNGDVIARMAS